MNPAISKKLVALRGNPSDHKIRDEPAIGAPTDIESPASLSAKAKAIWISIAPELAASGVLRSIDRQMFAIYCETLASWEAAQKYIRKNLNASTPAAIIALELRMKIADKTQAQLVVLSQQFGMTPKSRVHVAVAAPPDKNKFSALRNMKNGKGEK